MPSYGLVQFWQMIKSPQLPHQFQDTPRLDIWIKSKPAHTQAAILFKIITKYLYYILAQESQYCVFKLVQFQNNPILDIWNVQQDYTKSNTLQIAQIKCSWRNLLTMNVIKLNAKLNSGKKRSFYKIKCQTKLCKKEVLLYKYIQIHHFRR